MPFTIRPFQRSDRDQLTELVNLHVAAVIPGITVSVNTVMSQLEREPREAIVDPWVTERLCLVASEGEIIHAAALLHCFGREAEIPEDFRGAGDIRWLLCRRHHKGPHEAGRQLVEACIRVFEQWRVSARYADCALPAPACYGVPNTSPHIRHLLEEAGFKPSREEVVLAASCKDLITPTPTAWEVTRSVGYLGARFDLKSEDRELGWIEVCQLDADFARNSSSMRWSDVGNLEVAAGADRDSTVPGLLSVGARWLSRGGIEMLLAYHSDEDPPENLTEFERCGFEALVTNSRGWAIS